MKAAILNLTRSVVPLAILLGSASMVCAQASAGPKVQQAATQARSRSDASQDHGAAVPQQPSIAFDQIDRILLRGEAPPPVDSFAADAAVIASLPPLKANTTSKGKAVAKTAGSMLVSMAVNAIPFAGPLILGAASRAANAAQQAAERRESEKQQAALMRFISAGTLSRFAFYHSWLRSEHGREVTIVKPDENFLAVVDLANKTVHTIDTRTSPETIEIDTTEGLLPALVGEAVTERLPDATVSGLRARGYRTTATIELQQAMNWCAPGRHTVTQVEYVADLPDPQVIQSVPSARALADGCEPASTESYREPGRLVLYRATNIDPATPRGITMMFERGNVHPLDKSSVSLFSVPADFTKEQ
jgi:hypothetical protein